MASSPVLYCTSTGHGFGHAVRIASIAAGAKKLNPEIQLIMATVSPRWLLESYLQAEFIYRPCAFDVGVVQSDSFTMDKTATLAQMQAYRADAAAIVEHEANFLKTNKVDLVLGDIPALAVAIAHKANLPCWLVGNFGWDFIYRSWGDEFTPLADWISEQYSQCDCLFKVAIAEPMSAFPEVESVGLTGGTPRYTEADMRSRFGFKAPKSKTMMLTFGGLGLSQIPYERLQQFPDYQFITFDRKAPKLDNLRIVQNRQFRPVDFMPLCDRVISKPGYSTFAEAMRLGTPLISLTRDDFAESPYLLNGLQDHSPHHIIEPDEFLEGDWSFIQAPLNPPRTNKRLNKVGSEVIAKSIAEFLS
ncbi:MAG: glycosyl transferase [Cyanobacteria bacterium P01_H01_bin.15]